MDRTNKRGSTALSISIIGGLFFIFGFITWLNGVLIPFLQISCELSSFQALFVAFAFYISYVIMAPGASLVLNKIGFKNGMSLGLITMAIGSLIFIPAANTRLYWLFLVGLFMQGAGLTILQTASNPYIVIIGPVESAAKRISIMGICNKVAGVLSPLILGAVVLSDSKSIEKKLSNLTDNARLELLNELSSRVIMPYIIMAIVLIIVAILIKYSPLPDIDASDNLTEEEQTTSSTKNSIFDFPYLIYGFLALFFYVGAEVIAGDTIISYAMSLELHPYNVTLPLIGDINLTEARYFTSYTLAAMVIGYIVGIISIPRYLSQSKALAIFSVMGILFGLGVVITNGATSVLLVSLLGFANAIMWPAIWPLAIQGLGRFTKQGSALLIMAIAGGALLPLLYGALIGNTSDVAVQAQERHDAYWIMVLFYLIILWYAVQGHKITSYKK